jgi:hypothetical protein
MGPQLQTLRGSGMKDGSHLEKEKKVRLELQNPKNNFSKNVPEKEKKKRKR